MSLERDPITRHITFGCDDCNQELYTGTYEFHAAREALGDADWIVYNEGYWTHKCDSCKRNDYVDYSRRGF